MLGIHRTSNRQSNIVHVVKEKGESKPRQQHAHIDLSQMAVPIQLAQEKRSSPESARPPGSEAQAGAAAPPPGTFRPPAVLRPWLCRFCR